MSTTSRRVHLVLLLSVGAAILLRLGLTIFAPDPTDGDPALGARLVRFFSYFTIESAILVVLASLAVVRGADLTKPWGRALRMASLIGIVVTGVVYVAILAGQAGERSTLSSVANVLLHYVSPPLTVLVWLLVGPWPGLRFADILRVAVWPVAWGAWTFLHGAVTGWYPYGFIDATLHPAGVVARNFAGVVVFAALLGALAVLTDRRPRVPAEPPG